MMVVVVLYGWFVDCFEVPKLAFSVFNVYRVVYVHILTAHAHVFELHHAVWCLCLYMVGRARSKVCLPGD